MAFPRWYLGLFLVVFELVLMVYARRFSSVERCRGSWSNVREPAVSLNVLLAALALFGGLRMLWGAMRANVADEGTDRLSRAAEMRDRGTSDIPDYVTACIYFGVAAGLLVHLLAPVVAYAIVCASAALRFAGNLVVEERVRRRRAALLQRARRLDPVLFIWIAAAGASTFLLLPSLVSGSDRGTAVAVAACIVTMALVAWRIATAPPLLDGGDVEAEQHLDRARRIRRSGMVCVIAIGCASFYATIAEGALGLALAGFAVWAALLVWVLVSLKLASRALPDVAAAERPRYG